MEFVTQSAVETVQLRLLKGEDILFSLQRFCKQRPEIGAGSVQGIGAVSKAQIGFFNGEKYEENTFSENLELLSLTGNIAVSQAANQIVHIHGIFGRADSSCIGGHILPGCIVSVTAEIQIMIKEPTVYRKEDPKTKLQLLSLPHKL